MGGRPGPARGFPVADPWFRLRDAGDGVSWLSEPNVDPLIDSNVWLVHGRDRDLLVDTGNGFADLAVAVAPLADGRPVVAVVTHGHFDHVGGLAGFADRRCHEGDAHDTRSPYPMRILRKDFPPGADEEFAEFGLPVPEALVSAVPHEDFDVEAWVSPGAGPTSFVQDGDVIDLGDRWFVVMNVPGHTPGSVALWEQATRLLLTGDMLYLDEKLSFPDPESGIDSLTRLRGLGARRVLPGHGDPMDAEGAEAMIERELVRLRGG